MDYTCSDNASDISAVAEDSLRLLPNLQIGCWIEVVVGILGMVSNSILLTVAWKIEWFKRYQFSLVVHQAIVDMLISAVMTGLAIRSLYLILSGHPDLMTTFDCVLMVMPLAILFMCTQRCALIVAADRVFSLLFPLRWLRLGPVYRLVLISTAWFWALGQEMPWLLFVDKDQCTEVCFIFTSFSPDIWWGTVVTVSDTLVSCSIVIAYIIIPGLMATVCQRAVTQQKHVLTVYYEGVQQAQKKTMQRVRMTSFLVVLSYFCTAFVGFLVIDVVGNYVQKVELLLLIQPIACAWAQLNGILPLFLFIWKDEAFRLEIIKWSVAMKRQRKVTESTMVGF